MVMVGGVAHQEGTDSTTTQTAPKILKKVILSGPLGS
jgi:hypothetical protein